MPPLPWFKYYPSIFFNDPIVLEMTDEEVGLYHRMLWRAWEQDPPGTLPANIKSLSKILGRRPQYLRRLLSGILGKCWKTSRKLGENPPDNSNLSQTLQEVLLLENFQFDEHYIWNKRLSQEAEVQSLRSDGGRRGANITNTAYATAKAGAMAPASKKLEVDLEVEKERSKPKPFSHSDNGHLNAPWPDDLLPIRIILEQLGHLPTLGYVDFWQWVDTRTENTGVFYDEELKNYLGWWKEKPPSRRHKNLRKGFRNWIEEAIRRWEYAEKRRREREGSRK